MLRARYISHSAMYGVLTLASEDRALGVMVGSMGDGECLGGFLADAVGGRLDDGAPARIAQCLLSLIADEHGPANRPTWLLFAAALVRPNAVDVCHAGDLRIQLVRDGVVIATTIDHTMASEYGAVPPSPHAGVVVRSIKRGEPPPDRATWPFDGSGRVLITSYEVHQSSTQAVAFPDEGYAARYASFAAIELAF